MSENQIAQRKTAGKNMVKRCFDGKSRFTILCRIASINDSDLCTHQQTIIIVVITRDFFFLHLLLIIRFALKGMSKIVIKRRITRDKVYISGNRKIKDRMAINGT